MLALSCLLAGMLAAGCGSNTAQVTGKVTYQGKNLEFGSVSIRSSDGQIFQSEIKSDGTYSIPNVPLGPGKVSVMCQDTDKKIEYGKKISAEGKGMTGEGGKPKQIPHVDGSKFDIVPGMFANFETSGLTIDVQKGPKGAFEHNIDIPSANMKK